MNVASDKSMAKDTIEAKQNLYKVNTFLIIVAINVSSLSIVEF
jgi:hypothetical protein